MQISKNKIKWMRSLLLKKNRTKEAVFVAEGRKMVSDLMPFFECVCCYVVETLHPELLSLSISCSEWIVVDDIQEIKKISSLKTPPTVVAVFKQKDNNMPSIDSCINSLNLALDTIQDPGNMGTIIRLADWFGICHIFCSKETVDVYSPKCVQSTMGALSRVSIHYLDLDEWLEQLNELNVPIYGTFLDGDSIYSQELSANGIIVMGNEGNGVSQEVSQFINRRLLIPNYPCGTQTSESLNVAVATGIVCSEFRRR